MWSTLWSEWYTYAGDHILVVDFAEDNCLADDFVRLRENSSVDPSSLIFLGKVCLDKDHGLPALSLFEDISRKFAFDREIRLKSITWTVISLGKLIAEEKVSQGDL
jgi:hypothetical protein